MAKYVYAKDAGINGNVGFDFDSSQFGELEIFGTLMQFKHIKKRFWDSIGIGGSFLAAPLVYDNKIYIGCADKNFYCLDMEGNEKWRISVNDIIPFPAIENGGTIYFGSFDSNLYAVSPEGKILWVFHTNGKIMCSPTSYEGMVFTGSNDGNLYCIDARTGKEIWRFSTMGPQTNPIIHRDRVLFGHDDNTFYCLDLNGKLLWKFPATRTINAWPPDAHDGMVYLGCYDNKMYALDVETGRPVWEYKIGGVSYPVRVYKNRVYFGSRENTVYCLDAREGRLVWKFKTNGFVISVNPCEGVVYFGSYDNNFYAVDAETGKLLWKFKTNGFINNNTVKDGMVYLGSWDCNLYCLDAETGKLIWKFRSSMSTPSKISPPETTTTKTAEITWAPEAEKEKREGAQEADIADYGTFSGAYIDTSKTDYLGHKKKGYKTG